MRHRSSSREVILNALRRDPIPPVEEPPSGGPWTCYPDPEATFATSLVAAGGQCASVRSVTELREVIEDLPQYRDARRVIGCGPDFYLGPDTHATAADSVFYGKVDLLVAPGSLAVAENGAVWITTEHIPDRAPYFMVRDLVLVVGRDRIVHNLHEAYERIDTTKQCYGAFLAGPSKTADIEQTLVVGAHGPRSLTVILIPTSTVATD